MSAGYPFYEMTNILEIFKLEIKTHHVNAKNGLTQKIPYYQDLPRAVYIWYTGISFGKERRRRKFIALWSFSE